jgi:hypothetical protein
MTPLQKAAEARRDGQGKSKAAARRRAERTRGTALAGKPGETVRDSRGRTYQKFQDGSLRRVR